jgi:hypothetical protein
LTESDLRCEQILDALRIEQPKPDSLELHGLQSRHPLADGGRDSAKTLFGHTEQYFHLAFHTALPEPLSDRPTNDSVGQK